MIHVLVANPNTQEGETWRIRLEKMGLSVLPECLTLYDMTNMMIREKVHIVLCSAGMIDSNTIAALKRSGEFFPRIKIVVVGLIQKDYILPHFPDIALARDFESALRYYLQPETQPQTQRQETAEQGLRHLLTGHFLSQESAASFIAQTFKWTPGYTVIGISVDASHSEVVKVLENEAHRNHSFYILPFHLNEIYLILDNALSVEQSVQVGQMVRKLLFKETRAIFSIGISRMRYKAADLYACRKEAMRAFRATHLFGQNSVIHIQYLDSNDIEYIYPKHKEEKLIAATMDGDVHLAFQMLDEIFEVLKASHHLQQNLLNKIILGIIVNLNIAATARATLFEKMNLDSLALSRLLSAQTPEEAYAFLKQGIKDFADEMEALTDVKRDTLFYKLTETKAHKEIDGDTLAGTLGTTMGFINTAIYKNSGEDIFSFFEHSETRL